MGCRKQKDKAWTKNLEGHYVPKKAKVKHSHLEGSEDKENIPEYAEHILGHQTLSPCQTCRVRALSCNLFQQCTDIQAAKAQIMTCEEVIDEEDESQHQQVAGFLQVDGAAPLEDINLAKTPEIAEIDQFTGWTQTQTMVIWITDQMQTRSPQRSLRGSERVNLEGCMVMDFSADHPPSLMHSMLLRT